MPISVQQFDFIAETRGLTAALAMAEEAGGVTGTRDQATQIQLPGEGVETPTGMGAGWGGGLTRSGGEYMPGTLATDTSTAIGAAGTGASGALNLMSGGGGVLSADQTLTLQDLFARGAATDTSGDLPNAPLAEVITSGAPKAALPAEALMARANAGEILSVSEIATLERHQQMGIAKVVLGNFIAKMQEWGAAGNIAEINNSFRQIYDLWQNFYEPGGSEIDVLMKAIATERGFSGFFDGYEEALRSAGESLTGGPPTTGLGTTSFQFQQAVAPLQGTDKEIFDFLAGLYKKQSDLGTSSADILTAMLNEGADWMIGEPGLFGQDFTDRRKAYEFLLNWTQSPTQGNFGGTGWDTFNDAAMAMPAWTGTPAAAATPVTPVIPAVPGAPAPVTGGFDMGGLDPYGTWETLRPFSQIYPGFTSLLPGYGGSRAVQSAYAQAAAPLEMQYLAQQALTPYGVPGEEAIGSDVKSWLQNVQAGTQPLMMGQDYAGFLNQLAGVLRSPAGAMPTGMDANVYSKMAGLFQDPAAQLEAFKNPFYRATAGAPQVRAALMDQIQQAAQRYQYQEPSGAFLPWAMEQNLAGIQGLLPSLQGWTPPA